MATTALPDEVVAVAASYDQSLRYGAQTPFSDQLAVQWEGGQWQYDPQHDSIITAGNGGSKPTQVAFTIFYNQGTQKYELDQTLQPGDQMWMDIGKLIRESVPDKNDNTLPANLTSGSYDFRDLSGTRIGTLFEGKVIYDKTYGHVTYGCAACCGWGIPYLWYDPLSVIITALQDDGVYADYPCESEVDDVSNTFYNTWVSDATSVATVNYYGTHTGVSVGSTTSYCSALLTSNDAHERCPALARKPTAPVNVTPHITSITPDSVLVGSNNVQLTIAGAGFGSAPTVNLPSGVTKTGQGSTDAQIIITVNVSINTKISPNSITVTNTTTNLTSNQSPFTLDGPFNMVVQPNSDIMGKCNGCSTTVQRLVTYKVMNLSGSAAGAIAAGESYTPASGWNCTQTQPGVSIELCSLGFITNSDGTFTDGWTLSSDGYTPAGCGETGNNVDEWQWCPTTPPTGIGKLTGWVKSLSVSINSYVNPPNPMPGGTVINP